MLLVNRAYIPHVHGTMTNIPIFLLCEWPVAPPLPTPFSRNIWAARNPPMPTRLLSHYVLSFDFYDACAYWDARFLLCAITWHSPSSHIYTTPGCESHSMYSWSHMAYSHNLGAAQINRYTCASQPHRTHTRRQHTPVLPYQLDI